MTDGSPNLWLWGTQAYEKGIRAFTYERSSGLLHQHKFLIVFVVKSLLLQQSVIHKLRRGSLRHHTSHLLDWIRNSDKIGLA